MLKTYYSLIKPGIVYSNVMAAAAGFLLVAHWHINFALFLATLVGTGLVIASACIFNNYIDRDIDKKMARTKKRALVTHAVSGRSAIIYATSLGVLGFVYLALYSRLIVLILGAVAIFFYVVIYGYAKRRSVHGTLVGTIPGAIPPVAGYAAVTNQLDGTALLLFLIMVCWQMPHFYSIAMFRHDDYKAAGIPVLPVVQGMRRTKLDIIRYVFAFVVAIILFSFLGYGGVAFLIVMGGMGLYWLWRGIQGFSAIDDVAWARKMFGLSLIVLLSLCVMLATNPI